MRATILGPTKTGRNGRVSHNQSFTFKGHAPDAVTRQITASIINAVRYATMRLSKPLLSRMGIAMRAAANAEALLMLTAVENVLDSGQRSFTAGIMMPDVLLDGFGSRRVNARGRVNWAQLSPVYADRKAVKYPENADRILTASGRMASYFRRYGKSMVTGRYGGVVVDVTETEGVFDQLEDGLTDKMKGRAISFNALANGDRPSTQTLLGTIRIQIFPNIATGLLPGLASRRWDDVGTTNGAMERAMLAPSVALKLAGGGGGGGTEVPYRPLILPITQFWMLIRIPNAIAISMRKVVKNIV